MEDLTDSFNRMQVKRALFTDDVHPDDEDTLNISCWKTMRRSLSCGNIRDEDFYPSEVGKEMILRDQFQEAQHGYMFQDVTSCSSWANNSQHHIPEGFEKTVKRQCRELFSNDKDFAACSVVTSTPKSNESFLFPSIPAVSKTKDTILKSSIESDCENPLARRDSAVVSMLFFTTTAPNEFIMPGIVKLKKARTLDAGEMSKESFRPSNSSKEISRFQSLDVLGSDDTTSKTSVKNNALSLNGVESLWIVQPQALELDVNGKGRLLLINKSSCRNLKFKIVFDCKLINVCPQSGNLKSKSQLGLRIVASRCKSENSEVVEDIIRITCGNEEKKVPIKFRKAQKTKIDFKDRSFKCF